MGRLTIAELKARGATEEDIQAARVMQAAQAKAGAPVQSLAVLVGISTAPNASKRISTRFNAKKAVNFTEKALSRLSVYDKAALLLDQQALKESIPERAEKARAAAKSAKELSASKQLEFDFFGGNVSIAFQYQDAITERLFEKAKTQAQAKEALAILWVILRNLGWQSYECTKAAADLCKTMRMDKGDMARALDLLEQVGAIRRVKRGRSKVITITPEGAFRGNISGHAAAVEKYKLEVIDGGKKETPAQTDLEDFLA